MARPADLNGLRRRMLADLARASTRYGSCRTKLSADHLLVRWIAAMTAVEAYVVWERYAEARLVVALAHDPAEFVARHTIRGLRRIPVGLATVLVRGGGRYFDFRSSADLIDKGDRIVGKNHNPFRRLASERQGYLDTLGAIRNCIVHRSETAVTAYKRQLSKVYGMKARPDPDEFLNAVDFRATSPLRREPRVRGLIAVVESAIRST
jgi:hypothetical protein